MWNKDEIDKRRGPPLTSSSALGLVMHTPRSSLLEHLRCPRCGRYLNMIHNQRSGPGSFTGLDEWKVECRDNEQDMPACGASVFVQLNRQRKMLDRNHVDAEFYFEFRKMRNAHLAERVEILKETHALIKFIRVIPGRVGLPFNATTWAYCKRKFAGKTTKDTKLGRAARKNAGGRS